VEGTNVNDPMLSGDGSWRDGSFMVTSRYDRNGGEWDAKQKEISI
jgi:hypothetical protein